MSIYSDDLAFVGRVLEAAFATAQIQYDLIFLKRPQNLVHYTMLHKAATADVSFGGRRVSCASGILPHRSFFLIALWA